jgi:hypothetical protein
MTEEGSWKKTEENTVSERQKNSEPNKPTSSCHLRIYRVHENIVPKPFLTPAITYFLTYSLHAAECFLRN